MADIAPSILDQLFAGLECASGVIVAVSGGPDSIAMMHLLARWHASTAGPPLLVGTVDHGLRPASAAEALFVAREAAALGLPHRILTWTGPKPASGLQERARDARYGLLLGLATETGASHLVTAHNRDDQAETVLMRISRGSGLTGLGGMPRERKRDGIVHVRPLLEWSKASLLDLCRREGWSFLTDPSNADERFARVRWRRIAPALAAEGLTGSRLSVLARRLRQAEEALDRKAAEAFVRTGAERRDGALDLNAGIFATEPFDIAVRLLIKALAAAGLDLGKARLHRLEACTQRLRDALSRREALKVTVAGACLHLNPEGQLGIALEPPRRRGR